MPALGKIYRSAISTLGLQHYSTEQVAAWASYPDDVQEFRRWIRQAWTVVAVRGDAEPIGFGGLEESGRISSLFVRAGHMRRGVASAILRRLIERAVRRGLRELRTEASEFSKPVFAKFEFEVSDVEHTEFKGVHFTRYVMRRGLTTRGLAR